MSHLSRTARAKIGPRPPLRAPPPLPPRPGQKGDDNARSILPLLATSTTPSQSKPQLQNPSSAVPQTQPQSLQSDADTDFVLSKTTLLGWLRESDEAATVDEEIAVMRPEFLPATEKATDFFTEFLNSTTFEEDGGRETLHADEVSCADPVAGVTHLGNEQGFEKFDGDPRAYALQWIEEMRASTKDTDEKMEDYLADRRSRATRGDFDGYAEEGDTLQRLQDAKESVSQITDIVEFMMKNRGMGAKKLYDVIQPARDRIRATAGSDFLVGFEELFQEQTAREEGYYNLEELEQHQKPNSLLQLDPKDLVQTEASGSASLSEDSTVSDPLRSITTNALLELDPSSLAIVEKLRFLGRHGEWHTFRSFYDSLADIRLRHPAINIFAANVLLIQGCAKESLDVLDGCWTHYQRSSVYQPFMKFLCIARASHSLYCSSELGAALNEIMSLRNLMAEPAIQLAPSILEILAECQCCRVLKEGISESILDKKVFEPIMKARLETMIELLREGGRINDAVPLVLMILSFIEEPRAKEVYLTDILNESDLQLVSQAYLYLELSFVWTKVKSSLATTYLLKASELYDTLDSASGRLDVQMQRLDISDSNNPNKIPELLDISERCKGVGYYMGQRQALSSACSISALTFPAYLEFLNVFEKLDEVHTDLGHIYLQVKNRLLFSNTLLKTPAHIGKAVQGLRQWIDSGDQQMRTSRCQAASMIALGSSMLGDLDTALHYSKLALQWADGLSSEHDILNSRTQRATVLLLSGSKHDLRAAVALLELAFTEYSTKHDTAGQRKMSMLLAQTERSLAVEDREERARHEDRAKYWALMQGGFDASLGPAELFDNAQTCIFANNLEEGAKVLWSALEAFKKTHDSVGTTECQRLLFSCYARIIIDNPEPRKDPRNWVRLFVMLAADESTFKAFSYLQDPFGYLLEAARVFHLLADPFSMQDELRARALQYLTIAIRGEASMRKGISAEPGMASLLQRRMFVGKGHLNSCHVLALKISLSIPDPIQTWVWTQLAKAKALADVVASQFVAPAGGAASVDGDEDAQKLLAEESQILEAMRTAQDLQATLLGTRLDAVRDRMNEHPILRQARHTHVTEFDMKDLKWLFQSSTVAGLPETAKIVIVDWIIVDDRVVRVTLDSSLQPRMKILDLTAREIALFHSRYMTSSYPLRDIDEFMKLRDLDVLVTGLEESTDAEDLLIFSPSSTLHSIPMHALQLGKQIMIDRNPIVYISSLNILRHCHERRQKSSKTQPAQPRVSLFAEYPGVSSLEEQERTQIFDYVREIGDVFDAQLFMGSDASRENFTKAAGATDILHYHGHVAHHPNILDQALELSNVSGAITNPGAGKPRSARKLMSDHFTVRDVFALPLCQSLVTIIGCGSGKQDVAPGDEPLGLISALLCAGAATAVGTLWPIESADGRAFSLLFYYNLRNQIERQIGDDPSFVNVAVALREAVKGLKGKRKTSKPYHWAAFIMHGTWLL